MNIAAHPCHNCRRGRLKCDRSVPRCRKCMKRRQECLGYQELLRWEKGVASRGKLMGVTFHDMERERARSTSPTPWLTPAFGVQNGQLPHSWIRRPNFRSLTDPMLQDLSDVSKKYLSYFAREVCKDLVLYDDPSHNLFRDLIPLTKEHEVLRHVIIANSALHMSNAFCKPLISDAMSSPLQRIQTWQISPPSKSSISQQSKSYSDALAAKQRALSSLKSALDDVRTGNIDVILAVVLLFIEFELIDSGKDSWKWHITGARKILDVLNELNDLTDIHLRPLRAFLISNYLIFDILGSTMTSSTPSSSGEFWFIKAPALLQVAEANSCVSCPAALLQLIRCGAYLSQIRHDNSTSKWTAGHKEEQVRLLLQTAESFNSFTWAATLQPLSPCRDLEYRSHVASAHQAAVRIYLSRILLSISSTSELEQDLESLVSEVIGHLSQIPPDHALFKATVWPTFVAGAEATDPRQQAWVVTRLGDLWDAEPWGLIRSALGLLQIVWQRRNAATQGCGFALDWIQDIRGLGADWLIL